MMIRKFLLIAFAAVFAGISAKASEPVAADTLLCASTAENIEIISTHGATKLTVKNINGSGDNFYYQNGSSEDLWGDGIETRINCKDIKNITVCNAYNKVVVEYSKRSGEPQSYAFDIEDPENRSFKSYIGRRGSDFGLTISNKNDTRWEAISGGLGIGWIATLNDNPAMNTSMWESTEFTWLNIIGVRMTYKSHSLTLGFGLNWQNYVTKGDRFFHRGDDGRISLEPYEDGSTSTRSRIRVFSLQVPLTYTFRFGHKKYMGFQVGPVVNFNTGSSIKTEYKLGGREYSVKTPKIGQRPVTVDAFASISYRSIGLYVRYSPMQKLRSSAGLDFNTLTTGIILGY